MKKMILSLILVSISSSAFADICRSLTRHEAEKSLSFLTKGVKFNETYTPFGTLRVESVSVEKSMTVDGVDYFHLVVNGEPIDPGHTNIILNKNVSINLGRMVGCDSEASDPDHIRPTPMDKFFLLK